MSMSWIQKNKLSEYSNQIGWTYKTFTEQEYQFVFYIDIV